MTTIKRRVFLFLAMPLLLLALKPAFADEEVKEPVQPQEQLNITAIEVKGNKSISSNTVISKMKSRVGNPYQETMINDDIKRLYLLGYFSDIKFDTEKYKEGTKLIVTVEERPIIETINFSGIRYLRTRQEKLKEDIKSKETQYLDYPTLAEDVQTLKKMYSKIGFAQADINYKVDVNPETNKAKVTFEIKEAKRLTIKKISVEGNKSFPARRILKIIKTKRAWLFNAGVLKDDVFKDDLERIKAFYQKNGFADATVDSQVSPDPNPKRPFLYITLKINEGKKYLVGSITIQGNKDILEKDILGRIKEAVPDKVFSQEAMKQDIVGIQSLYFDRGYISAQVEETTALEPATGRVNITYNISENQVTYVGKIKIKGNVKTKDIVIRRELRIKPGDRFDGEKLRRSKERLDNLGFFEEISYDTEETPVSDKKDLVVNVKETKTGAFSFGGGYSTVEQFVGFVEVEQKNFDWKNFPYFTGAGQDLRFRASTGSLSQGFDLSFTEPWIFDYPVSFGFDAYQQQHERDTDVGYGYDEEITGGDVRLGKDLTEYLRGNWAYRIESIDISGVTDTASQDLKDEAGENNISSMEFGLTYDTRDNIFSTNKGDLVSGSLNWAGGPFAGDKDFWKIFTRASHYFPLFRGSVLETRGRLGLADAYGDTKKMPIYERFFAGGADTIRGYHERKIGPIDPGSSDPIGGNALLIGNFEYLYPLASFLKGALFYDVGNIWAKTQDLGTSGFKSSFGLGMRIKTPIGPIKLDYGVPLNKEPGEEDKGNGRFHFSVSHGF